jgi:putative restriction endonuclease
MKTLFIDIFGGKTPIDHIARARKAWPILVSCASQKECFLTYGVLCAKIGLHHRAARFFLGVVQTYCEENNLPPIQALVVNKKTLVPGHGYHGSPIEKTILINAIVKVRQFKWDEKPKF